MSLHFTAGAWADLARGVAEPAVDKALRTHLDTGCSDCARELAGWRAVHELARHEAAYEPPEAAVRVVEGCFVLNGPERAPSRVVRFLRLAFDSLRQPTLEGVRAGGPVTRQVLYEADRFTVDIRTEKDPASSRVSLVGQVLDNANPGRPLADVQIRLHQAGTPIARTKANEQGEFHFSFEPAAAQWLSIEVGGMRALVMVLSDVSAPYAGAP